MRYSQTTDSGMVAEQEGGTGAFACPLRPIDRRKRLSHLPAHKAFLIIISMAGVAFGQALDPAKLLKPPTDSWPTYNGDYSGRRYSTLAQINSSNIHTLSLVWVTRFASGAVSLPIKATPLLVNGILYFSVPNKRLGRRCAYRAGSCGTISTRRTPAARSGIAGVGMYGNWLFFESPDSHLISLDAKTGRERWKVEIVDPKLDYTSTAAPIVVGNHILVGIGGDHLDNPGFLESRDPENRSIAMEVVDHAPQG